MKRVPIVILALTLLASGTYVGIYLDRWEWTRALFVSMVFVAAEVALVGALALQRLNRLQAEMRESGARPQADPRVLGHLRATRPENHRFEWLRSTASRTNVFITLVVGGGVILSGLAWVVDQVAARTLSRSREQRLAEELSAIAFPEGPLVEDESALLAQDFPTCRDDELRLLTGETRGMR